MASSRAGLVPGPTFASMARNSAAAALALQLGVPTASGCADASGLSNAPASEAPSACSDAAASVEQEQDTSPSPIVVQLLRADGTVALHVEAQLRPWGLAVHTTLQPVGWAWAEDEHCSCLDGCVALTRGAAPLAPARANASVAAGALAVLHLSMPLRGHGSVPDEGARDSGLLPASEWVSVPCAEARGRDAQLLHEWLRRPAAQSGLRLRIGPRRCLCPTAAAAERNRRFLAAVSERPPAPPPPAPPARTPVLPLSADDWMRVVPLPPLRPDERPKFGPGF